MGDLFFVFAELRKISVKNRFFLLCGVGETLSDETNIFFAHNLWCRCVLRHFPFYHFGKYRIIEEAQMRRWKVRGEKFSWI